MNTNDLTLFPGQGVRHPDLGYGAVHRLNLDELGCVATALVGFTTGEHNVPAESLSNAPMPEAERLQLVAKHTNAKKDHRPTRKPTGMPRRKRVRCRPILEVGAKALHAEGRVTVRVVGPELCLVSFRNRERRWVYPSELYIKRFPNRPE